MFHNFFELHFSSMASARRKDKRPPTQQIFVPYLHIHVVLVMNGARA